MGAVSTAIFTSSSGLPLYTPTHNKVSLVMYATVEIHESGRVLRQFSFRQLIPMTPQDIEDMHHVDLRGRTDENWITFHVTAQFRP
ncbi:hypothetical protein Gotur_010127 [Gossypium turneri]